MKSLIRLTLLLVLTAITRSQMKAQAIDTPPLTGTVTNGVQNINTGLLLAQMNHGSGDLTLVAAHRGYWINAPENSTLALQAAFDAGVEVIEIDLRTTSDGVLIVSHDTDLIKETTGTGLISATPWSTISQLQLRNRKGVPQNLTMLRFEDALSILSSYSSGSGSGPVIIADLKDQSPWPAYVQGVSLVQSVLPSATQQAVVFKMKMKSIPSIDVVNTAAADHPSYGHLIPVVNAEDVSGNWSPSSANYQTLFNLYNSSPHFIQQFELNINNVGDGASTYPYPGAGRLQSFASYYEPKFYPEGVSTITVPPSGVPFTNCCYNADLPHNPNPPTPRSIDLRGVLNFSLYYGQSSNSNVSLITSDNLAETLNYLISVGKRNVSEIQ